MRFQEGIKFWKTSNIKILYLFRKLVKSNLEYTIFESKLHFNIKNSDGTKLIWYIYMSYFEEF